MFSRRFLMAGFLSISALQTLQARPLLEYATYLGGRYGDQARTAAVDAEGYVYIAGLTGSPDLPVTPGSYSHDSSRSLFVAKLSPDGSELVYSTFLGGSDAEVLGKVAVDDQGCAYACFMTNSTDFPTTEDAFDRTYNGGAGFFPDSVVAKLSANGSELLYATYLGGSVGEDSTSAIAVDETGCVYLSGTTSSPDFPTSDRAYDRSYNGGDSDIFVVKLDPSGSELVYGTFLGGSGYDGWPDMTLDSSQRVVLAGQTQSADFPVTTHILDPGPNSGQNICLAVLSSDGTSLEHASLLGGSGNDSPGGIGLDRHMNIVLAGSTDSTDFPVTPDAFQPAYQGAADAFLCRLDATLSELCYATFLGGHGQEATMDLATDADDNAAIVGLTGSIDFPTTRQALDGDYNGPANPAQWVGDAFVTKFAMNIYAEEGSVHNLNLDRRYHHIRHAVQDASDGDEIAVTPGIYHESVELLDKDLVLRSLDPNDPFYVGGTIIQGALNLPVLTMAGNGLLCEIAGLTLRAGSVGISGSGTDATVRNCRIMDNVTHGLELSEGSRPHLLNCLIADNGETGITMLSGTGRWAQPCTPIIENCTIVQNGQTGLAGGEPVVVDSLVTRNADNDVEDL